MYLWKIRHKDTLLIYIGRTGDSSSLNAGSPLSRMRSHFNDRPNARGNSILRQLKSEQNIDPAECYYEMLAIGPIYPEQKKWNAHTEFRDTFAAMERELAQYCRSIGYRVVGNHASKKRIDMQLFERVIPLVNDFLSDNGQKV